MFEFLSANIPEKRLAVAKKIIFDRKKMKSCKVNKY